ncbi:MAG: Dabb family protein [Paludibacteraceae bacterium]|nr:Dabb family protein [Paludibacteraceae bacterium]
MIKHVVLFKLKEFNSPIEKQNKMKQIQMGLTCLKAIIPEILSIEVGLNTNPKEKFDIALTTTHKSMEDLAIYANHPKHLDISKIIREVLEDRSCVDFEF